MVRRSRQRVSGLLIGAGIDPFADAGRLRQEAAVKFREVWEAASDLATAAKRLGLTVAKAKNRAAWFRRRGIPLKFMPLQRRPAKSDAIEALLRRGLTTAEIISRGIACPGMVYAVLRRYNPARSAAGTEWTAEEDRLLATLSDAEVADRTGRKASAVRRRRKTLRCRRG
jgi:hypothetical protein